MNKIERSKTDWLREDIIDYWIGNLNYSKKHNIPEEEILHNLMVADAVIFNILHDLVKNINDKDTLEQIKVFSQKTLDDIKKYLNGEWNRISLRGKE